ncbi:MAG TPA: alpha/beta hydrolase, partial [Gemmatimonadales bacterium]
YIPARWIAASRFASIDRIGQVTIPKLFLHAIHDDVIPLRHGRRLYDAAPPPKTFVELQGGHGDAFEVDSARYFGAIREFIGGL